jgi:hypothetical protein
MPRKKPVYNHLSDDTASILFHILQDGCSGVYADGETGQDITHLKSVETARKEDFT